MSFDPSFAVQSVNAIGMLFVAIVVGVISYHQYRLQREAHKLSLFDRRFDLFKVQQIFLSEILATACVKDESIGPYIDAMQKSTFLLDDEIRSYIEEIYRRAVHMRMLQAQIKEGPAVNRNQKIDEEHEELAWLTNQLPVLVERYKRFLKMKL